MAKIITLRFKQNQFQATGILWLKPFFFCRTLELPWRNNQRNISCIPPGKYPAEKGFNSKGVEVIKINDVPGRDGIQIHPGNTYKNIKGCIIPGIGGKDIDGDGVIDVTESKPTMKKILDRLPDKLFIIKIVDWS